MNNKTILLIDDSVENLDIIGEILKEYDVVDTTSATHAFKIVQDEKIDLILLDIVMPDIDGFEACKYFKSQKESRDIPIIFLTAKSDEESIETAYDLGGIDYVSKPVKPKELLARVKTQLELQKLIFDLEESKKELKLLASTDSMTGLYNRRYFQYISENIAALDRRDKEDTAFIMLDIDKFKSINDTFGHAFGDRCIIFLAKILNELKRESDLLFRFGGDEFLILLPKTSQKGALNLSQKIRVRVEESIIEDEKISFTVSIGVSVLTNDDKNVEGVLIRADKALYNSKESGRNRVSSF